jgi:hypothetical protein
VYSLVTAHVYSKDITMTKTDVTSIRLQPGTLRRLQTLASLESLRLGRRVSVSALLRSAVEEKLAAAFPGLGVAEDEK